MAHVLIVDDDLGIRRTLDRVVRGRGDATELCDSGEAALEAVRARRPDLVLLDLHMGGIGGMETLERLSREARGVPVVIMTARGSVELAVDAFKLGAVDFVTKPCDDRRLLEALDALLSPRSERPDGASRALVGESPQFQQAMDLVVKFARPDINVLLEGETGTGKELFARALHDASKRASKPFVAVDCATLSASLLESELFGHEKGSFTGATTAHIGYFERANGGTMFLDEVGNLPPSFQAKLLRVLQEQTLQRIGGRETIQLDLRIVSATNVDLRDASRTSAFRSDLYFRLAEITIRPPPLREREGDVARIAAHFAARYALQFELPVRGISPRALARLNAYPWPGNVRELRSAIKSAVVLARDLIEPNDLPEEIGGRVEALRLRAVDPAAAAVVTVADGAGPRERLRVELDLDLDAETLDLKALAADAADQAERAVIEAVIRRRRYSLKQLADKLGLDSKTLRTKLRKYGLASGTE